MTWRGATMGMARAGLCTAALLILAACTPEARLPDLQQIYNATTEAGADGPGRRPLIAIPGTLGSKLVDSETGVTIWGGGGSAGISADPDDPTEYALIALPIAQGDEPLSDLVDTIRPDGVLETAEAQILGIPIDINVYGESIKLLGEGGFTVLRRVPGADALDVPLAIMEERAAAQAPPPAPEQAQMTPEGLGDFNSFQFDYDWRRDLVESAHRFGQFLRLRRAQVAAKRGVPPETVRFDLLAHSMGSMVSRYFLMYGFADPPDDPDGPLPPVTWAGADYFDRVVFVAPPNGGSIIAMDNLINGKELGPLQPVYPAAMLATHPSPYQLMPRTRHKRMLVAGEPDADIFDPELWIRMGWGLADPRADAELAILMPEEESAERRRERAVAFMARLLGRAKVFQRMMDRWAPPPQHLHLFLVVGGGFQTPSTAEVDPATGSFVITQDEEGDGVVLRASALLDERMDGDFSRGFRSPLRFNTTLFLPDEHVELTRNRVFGDNLLFWLLEAPRGGTQLARPSQGGLLANVSDGDRAAPTTGAAAPDLPMPGADR
ncbi:MAG: hypothetical protein AAF674_04980 [Pseudomonadota bacterium]